MSGLSPLRQEPNETSRTSLYEEIRHWVAVIESAAANLPAPGSHAATRGLFEYLQTGLLDLATRLIDYTHKQRHPYYIIIHRSSGTLAAAEATIAKAKQCARLFEGYSRNDQKYDRVDTALELRYLLTQLTNLSEWLKPEEAESSSYDFFAPRPAAGKSDIPPRQRPSDTIEPTAPPTPVMTPLEMAERLAQGFNKEEMVDLAFKLGFDIKHLAEGRSPFSMARELVVFMNGRGRLPALVELARLERPNLFA